METVTFYSYKGGVGRTLTLANIAIYLSRFGKRVCIVDFDLEAPGLHYKFPNHVKTTDIERGLVDLIYEFTQHGILPDSLSKYTIKFNPPSPSHGEITLLPAGNGLSSSYWSKLSSIDWYQLFFEKRSEGIPYFLELKEQIERELKPDFLLIDSRTGITEMSGICTSLLPDKVVFLVVNNRENIEGARQILQKLIKVERLPTQKPIDVIIALTRIPITGQDHTAENTILQNVIDYFNEPAENLEYQLDIKDICILHSDRDLEISESLRINDYGNIEDIPLLKDYLKLFSKIIPSKVILTRLDTILDEITRNSNLLEDPDKVEKELKSLVVNYPHPKSYEKLISYYILRNESRDTILSEFHKLWETFGIENLKMLSKYISFFMKLKTQGKVPFNLSIIEKYLELGTDDKTEVEKRLAEAYYERNLIREALIHYKNIINFEEIKNGSIEKMLDICIKNKFYENAFEISETYSEIINEDPALKAKIVDLLTRVDNIEKAVSIFSNDVYTKKEILRLNPLLYGYLLIQKGEKIEEDPIINEIIAEYANHFDREEITKVADLFYQHDKRKEFLEKIKATNSYSPSFIEYLDDRLGHNKRLRNYEKFII